MINGQTIIKTEKGKNWPCMNDPKPPSPLKSTNFRVQKDRTTLFPKLLDPGVFKRERERARPVERSVEEGGRYNSWVDSSQK